jgi:hypothetical protein
MLGTTRCRVKNHLCQKCFVSRHVTTENDKLNSFRVFIVRE